MVPELILPHLVADIETRYLISACSKIQLNVNPYLFDYALSVVLLHRSDTRRLRIPSQVTYMPEFYVPNHVLTEVSRQVAIVQSVPSENVSSILKFEGSSRVKIRSSTFPMLIFSPISMH